MAKDSRTITEQLRMFDEGQFDRAYSIDDQIDAGWYDWFCKDSSLYSKTLKLMKKLKSIANSEKFDNDKTYVFFKNNCPMSGTLYDDFRICDIETGDVIYTITPSVGYYSEKKRYQKGERSGLAEVWGRENDFDGALVEGSWSEIKKWFFSKEK